LREFEKTEQSRGGHRRRRRGVGHLVCSDCLENLNHSTFLFVLRLENHSSLGGIGIFILLCLRFWFGSEGQCLTVREGEEG
jgi:hypothetical protein